MKLLKIFSWTAEYVLVGEFQCISRKNKSTINLYKED